MCNRKRDGETIGESGQDKCMKMYAGPAVTERRTHNGAHYYTWTHCVGRNSLFFRVAQNAVGWSVW